MKRKSSDLTVEFKRAAVALMAPGVKVSALARELGVCRQRLYEWREALRLGDDRLRRPGRPKRRGGAPGPTNELGGGGPGGGGGGPRASARAAAAGTRFFQASLAASRGVASAEQRALRDGVYALIQAMTQQQGSLSVERLCTLAQVSRAGYYRHWQAVAPRTAETALRDEVQRLALADRHCGYRRIAQSLQRAGWRVNHKRVLRLMREDNLLCLRKKAFVPATTDSRHSWRIYPNL